MDKLEDEIEKNKNETIKNVCKLAEKKIKSYYPTTDGDVYIIATSKFIYYFIYYCLVFFFVLISFIVTLKY
jgi:hypothetical protein